MKKILWNLQLSAIRNGNFLLDKDSNFRFVINTIKAFNKYCKKQYDHIVLIPCEWEEEHDTPLYSENIEYKYCDNYITKIFSSRYNWNVEEMDRILLEVKPDIIWENNPTLINNWKTLLLEEKMIDKVKIICYDHWIDSEDYSKIDKRTPYWVRQSEGYVLSDMMLCNSDEAIKQIYNQFYDTWGRHCSGKNLFKFPPLIDEDEFNNKIITLKHANLIKIIYNHRLSSMDYYNEPFKLFLNVLEKLKREITLRNIEVILTDASGKIKNREDIDFKDSQNIKLILKGNMNREDYLNELKSSDICIGLFQEKSGGCWSISLAEAIMSNCAVLMPNHSGYGEMIPENSSGIIDTKNITDIILSLKASIYDNNLRILNSKEKIKFYKKNYNSKKLILELDKRIKEMYI